MKSNKMIDQTDRFFKKGTNLHNFLRKISNLFQQKQSMFVVNEIKTIFFIGRILK